MAPITTVTDVQTMTGVAYTEPQKTRLTQLIPLAERYVKRRTGQVFYDATDVASDASEDWLLVVSLVADRLLNDEDVEVRAARLGPFQSERMTGAQGEYSYTLKAGGALLLDADPRIAELIAAYQQTPALVPLLGMVINGPTRVAPPVCDPDVSRDVVGWLG